MAHESQIKIIPKEQTYCIKPSSNEYGHMEYNYEAVLNHRIRKSSKDYSLNFYAQSPMHPGTSLNLMLHIDLQVPYVTDEIRRLSLLYNQRLQGHNNKLTGEIRNPPVTRRLKRQWPSDLSRNQK
jgi:hypothetical protein